MSANTVINIHDDLKHRTIPIYSDAEVLIYFKDENEYNDWYTNIASNHANWGQKPHIIRPFPNNYQFIGKPLISPLPVSAHYYHCDHFKKQKKRDDEEENEVKRRKTNKISKRTGCTARIIKYLMTDNSIKVNYKWQHHGHDPSKAEEIIKSTLPAEVKEWIIKHVEQDMDWKQIRKLLRIDESRLDEVSHLQ